MKIIKQFGLVFVVAVAAILTSCSSDSSGGGGSASVGTLKAKVGGANFSSISQAANGIIATSGTFQNLSIFGADASGKSLSMTILAENIGVGTYQITDQAETVVSGTYSETNINNPTETQVWSAPYDGGGNSGSIVITSKTDTNVQGTFSFTAKSITGTGNKAITNGVFNVNLTSN